MRPRRTVFRRAEMESHFRAPPGGHATHLQQIAWLGVPEMPLQLLLPRGVSGVKAVFVCCVAVGAGYLKLCCVDEDSIAIGRQTSSLLFIKHHLFEELPVVVLR